MPHVTRESTQGRPRTGEVDTDGRRSTHLRATKNLGPTLKAGPASCFFHDEEHTPSLPLACAAGSLDCKGFSVEEEARRVRASPKSSPSKIVDKLGAEASVQATSLISSPPKIGERQDAEASV